MKTPDQDSDVEQDCGCGMGDHCQYDDLPRTTAADLDGWNGYGYDHEQGQDGGW